MGLLSWILIGGIVGLLFAFLGRDRSAETVVLVLSAAWIGALAGGLVVTLLRFGRLQEVRLDALIVSLLSAALLAAGVRLARRLAPAHG